MEAIQAGAIAAAEVITMDGVEAIIAIDENPHGLAVIILEQAASVWRLFLCYDSFGDALPGTLRHVAMSVIRLKADLQIVPAGFNSASGNPHMVHDTIATTQARTEKDQG